MKNIKGIVKDKWIGMDGETLDNLSDEILEKELEMKLYADRFRFLMLLNELKTLNCSSNSHSSDVDSKNYQSSLIDYSNND
jgi:hypothetical protein